MKKCVALILSFLLVLACCGCNNNGTKDIACYLLTSSNSLAADASKYLTEASESKWWNTIRSRPTGNSLLLSELTAAFMIKLTVSYPIIRRE